jgi:cell division protein ZapA (FtsZ GTPase activity inhibitor)
MTGQSSTRPASSHLIALSSRQFEIGCAPGDEARLASLAEHVKERFEALQSEHGAVGEDRLLVMTALTLADALLDSEAARATAEARAASAERALAALQSAAAPKPRAKATSAPPPAHPPTSTTA